MLVFSSQARIWDQGLCWSKEKKDASGLWEAFEEGVRVLPAANPSRLQDLSWVQVSFTFPSQIFELLCDSADNLKPIVDEIFLHGHELIPEKDKDKEPMNLQLSPDLAEVRSETRVALKIKASKFEVSKVL